MCENSPEFAVGEKRPLVIRRFPSRTVFAPMPRFAADARNVSHPSRAVALPSESAPLQYSVCGLRGDVAMLSLGRPHSSRHALARRIGLLLIILFGPLIVTFLIVYAFPDQYRWLVETTQPLSMAIVERMLDLVSLLPFINIDDSTRSANAMEVAFSGDNLFGCYVGVATGALITRFIRSRREFSEKPN